MNKTEMKSSVSPAYIAEEITKIQVHLAHIERLASIAMEEYADDVTGYGCLSRAITRLEVAKEQIDKLEYEILVVIDFPNNAKGRKRYS